MTSNQNTKQQGEEAETTTTKSFKHTREGGKHVGRYFKLSKFGEVAWSKIYVCIVDDENDPEHGKKFLMKKYDKERVKTEQMAERLALEIALQKNLTKRQQQQDSHSPSSSSSSFHFASHVHTFGLETLQTQSKIYCVGPMRPEKSRELLDTVVEKQRLSEKLARRFFRQMVIALRFCHAAGVASMDLKLEHFQHDPDSSSVFLTEFELACAATKSARLTEAPGAVTETIMRMGTPNYVAPEVLTANEIMAKSHRQKQLDKMSKEQQKQKAEEEEGEEKGRKEVPSFSYDYSPFLADCYSLGVVLYVMVAGHLPFDDPNMAALFKKIQRQEYKMSKQFSEQLSDLISHLICYEKDRYSTRDIILHPWFLSEDTEGEEGAFDFKRLLVARDTFTLWPTFRPLFQVAYRCRDSKSKLSSCLSSVYNIRHYCALFLPIVSSKESLKEIDR